MQKIIIPVALICLFAFMNALSSEDVFADDQSALIVDGNVDGENISFIPYGKKIVEKGDFSDLKLHIQINKNEFDRKEPILVRILLKNESNRDILVYHDKDVYKGQLSLNLFHDDKVVPSIKGGNDILPTHRSGLSSSLSLFGYLHPGKEVEIFYPQQSLERSYRLEKPGRYRISVHLNSPRGSIKSNVVSFSVNDVDYVAPLFETVEKNNHDKKSESPERFDNLQPNGDYGKLKLRRSPIKNCTATAKANRSLCIRIATAFGNTVCRNFRTRVD